MADMNALIKAYQQDLTKQQATRDSLSQRLTRIDEFAGQVNPAAQANIAQVGLQNRPEGMNPLDAIVASLGVGERTMRTRTNAAQDYGNANASVNDLYKLLLSATESQNNYDLKAQELALEKQKAGVSSNDPFSSMNDSTAVAQVKKLLNIDKTQLGGTAPERGEMARELLRMLANEEEIPINMLANDKEKAHLQLMGDLSTKLQTAKNALAGAKNGPGGTGPLIGKIPAGWLQAGSGADMRRVAADIQSTYLKNLSGATVSDAESERLEKLLPSGKKTESLNLADIEALDRGIKINEELFRKAKLNNITPNQALEKFGREMFEKYGEKYPYADGKSSSGGSKKSSSSSKNYSSESDVFDPDRLLNEMGY